MKTRHQKPLAAFSLITCLLVMSAALAQTAPQGPMTRNPLAGLKRALSDAGAPALTAGQEEQLTALIAARRAALQAQRPGTVGQSAHRAYQTAILNGDNSGAQAQADTIANELATQTRTRLKDAAKFEIDVLNVLKSNDDQVGILTKRIGSAGLSQLLGMLAGPQGLPGGPMGPRMGGPGFGPREFEVKLNNDR